MTLKAGPDRGPRPVTGSMGSQGPVCWSLLGTPNPTWGVEPQRRPPFTTPELPVRASPSAVALVRSGAGTPGPPRRCPTASPMAPPCGLSLGLFLCRLSKDSGCGRIDPRPQTQSALWRGVTPDRLLPVTTDLPQWSHSRTAVLRRRPAAACGQAAAAPTAAALPLRCAAPARARRRSCGSPGTAS